MSSAAFVLSPSRRGLGRAALAIATVSALVLAGATAAHAAGVESGTVDGFVFRDFNANGAYDTANAAGSGLANDVALPGVTATAYDAQGDAVGSAVSDANGDYSIVVTNAYSDDLRIEFTFSAAQLAEGYQSSAHGADNGTSVQVAQIGDSDVNFAGLVPEDYTQNDPRVALTAQRPGDPLAAAFPTDGLDSEVYSSVVTLDYEQDSDDATDPTVEALVFADGYGVATGSLYGVAAPRGDDSFYASAVLRRHAGVGAAGLGAIYAIDPDTHVASLLVDLDDGLPGGIDVGEAAFSTAVGSPNAAGDNAARGLTADTAEPTNDSDAWPLIGKIGLGGLAASTDGSTLYAINLYSKSLVIIDIATGSATEVSLGALSVDARPFAVAVHRGQVVVGITDSAQSTGSRAGLGAQVISTPESAIGSPTWTEILAVTDLSFARGAASNGAYGTPNWTLDDVATHWNAWTDDWDAATSSLSFGGVYWNTNPQPLLSALTFDVSGNLVLGFLDRYAYQTGMVNAPVSSADVNRYSAIASGGLLGASPNGDGTYTLESNGVLGGVAGAGVGNNRGPGGGQFYVTNSGAHASAFTGAAAAAPGFSTFLATGYDLSGAWSSEAGWMPIDGSANALVGTSWRGSGELAQRVINNALGDNGPVGYGAGYGKAGGLGGVTVLAEAAPVEIGNRVWFDADQDGIQDADEPGIEGVTVNLLASDGVTVLQTTTTDANGEYYFTVDPDTEYVVQFVVPTTGSWDGGAVFGQVPWSSFEFTAVNVGTDPAIDSDAVPTVVPSIGEAAVTVGGPGENDHTIDAGLIANLEFLIEKVDSGEGATPPAGGTYTIDIAAIDFRGDPIAASPAQVLLEVGETSDPISVPVGAAVLVTEATDPAVTSVEITYPGWATSPIDDDYLLVVEDDGEPLTVEVSNTFTAPGNFTITKVLSGDDGVTLADLGPDVEFIIAVTVDDSDAADIVLSGPDFTYESPDYPAGTVITLQEISIDGAPAWAGWGDPVWSVGDDGDGIATITIAAEDTIDLELNNPVEVLQGSVDVTKTMSEDAEALLPDGFDGFVVQYSTDGGGTWISIDPAILPNETVTSPQFPVGTEVLFREDPASIPVVGGVDFGTPVFSGTGTPQSDGSFLVVIEEDIDDVPAISLTLNNPTEVSGQFALVKDVTGPAEPLLADGASFDVTYSYPGQVDGPVTVTLVNGAVPWVSESIPSGTVVTITEVAPTTGLPAGATWGTPVLIVDGGAPIANGSTITIGDATVVEVVVENPTDVTPTVSILKGDGDAETATIVHEADTVTDGEVYVPGETRDIVIVVQNTGPEPLVEVELGDVTTTGESIESLVWTFPNGGGTAAATFDEATQTWTATWPATFGADPLYWQVGDVIVGRATLTVDLADFPHQDIASVDAVGAYSGEPVDDENPYNAYTGGIQVIKYDGEKPDPEVGEPGAWVIPTKPLVDAAQDANTPEEAVAYPIDEAQVVRWVVTNTGTTWLTDIDLVDITLNGPSIPSDWTADLSDFGGPEDYSFIADGPWPGLFPPGASFFAEGTLTLEQQKLHGDLVVVQGTQVVPATNPETGEPTDEPLLDDGGDPVIALDDADAPIVYADSDPFHARTPAKPLVGTGQVSDSGAMVGLAGLLMLVGAALVVAVRRRRRTVG